MMLTIGGASDLTIDRVVNDGQRHSIPSDDFQGSLFGDAGDLSTGIALTRSTIEDTDDALFQDNAVTAVLDGFSVDRLRSDAPPRRPRVTAPSEEMTNGRVTNSTCAGNRARDDARGFGFAVGMANVRRA